MDIETLKTFQKIAQVGNIQKAADELYISQSSAINRVRVFEKEIGYKLFRRNGRGVELTSAGEHLLHYVEKMIDILEQGLLELKNLKKSAGNIPLASIATAASYLLPHFLQLFHERHPDVGIQVTTADSSAIIDWVLNGKAEIGVVKGPIYHMGLDCLPVSVDPIVLVVHTEHPWARSSDPVSPAYFTNEIVLPLNRKTLFWTSILEWFEKHSVRPNIGMEFDHPETIKQMVLQNFGVAFLPLSVIQDSVSKDELKVIPLDPPLHLSRETLFICNNKKALSSQADRFWDFIKDHHQAIVDI
jgi:DNA-binding transcriptional LysR family regulator